MINEKVLSSVFGNYDIHNVILLPMDETYNFVISNMPSSISLERWKYLENILKDITKKEINLFAFSQAISHFGEETLKKGMVIKSE